MAEVTRFISLSQRCFASSIIFCGYLWLPVAGLYASSNANLLTVGGQATLTCTMNYTNEPTFWWRNDRQLQNDTVKYLIHTRDVNTTLTIRNTGEEDVGVYQCSTYHPTRHDVILFSLPVVNDPGSRSVTLTEGDEVELACTGWGWPVPRVIWTRADGSRHVYRTGDVGVTLRDAVTSFNVTLRGSVLHIQNVNRSDQLNYVCTIANSLGHSNVTIFLRVKDRLAAVWPTIGIIIEVVVLIIFIAICEVKSRRKAAKEEDAKCK